MPAISIVAPVYGVEQYIHQFLQSIKDQTLKDIEVILVDDGSPDNCPAILDAFSAADERYHVIHQANGGVSVARNTGLARATGSYVFIADSDDWLEADAMEKMWEAAQKTDADLIYSDWIRESRRGSTRIESFPSEFCTEDRNTLNVLRSALFSNKPFVVSTPEFNGIRHLGGAPWRYIVKREIIEKHGLRFDPYVKGMGDDILFALHLYEHIGKVAYVQTPIYHYRIVEGTYTNGYKADLLERYQPVFERMEAYLDACHADDQLRNAYYIRVLLYLSAAMDRYFRNPSNPKPAKERYREFKQLMKTSPYREMVVRAPAKRIGSRRLRIKLYLLRWRLYRLFWRV